MKPREIVPGISVLAISVLFLMVNTAASRQPIILHELQVDGQNKQASLETYLESKNRHFPDGELIADVNFLMKNLIENHPQLYGYTAEDSFKKEWERTLKEIDHNLTLEAYFKVVAPLVEKVNCSHTGIRLPVLYLQAAFEHGNYLPLELVCMDHKAYYISSYGGKNWDIIPGSEIHSINEVPISEIIGQMLSLIPSEGGCLTTKYNEINRNFHTYFYLLDNSEAFEVEFLSPNANRKIKFPPCSYQDVTLHNAKEEPILPVEFISDKNNDVGMIRVSSFNIRDMEGYMKLLDQLFLEFQANKPSHLIIDLRDNTGGHPIFAAQLLSYLTTREFTYFKRNHEVEDFEPLYNPMQSNPLHYEGNLFVLVNGGCLSTTGHLISLLKYHTNAKFVGEEPGSSYYCNDFGMQVTLPNSGLEVNIPRTTFETAVSGFKKGEPFPVDYYVENSVTDIIKGTDCYLSRVYKLIDEERSMP